MKKKKKISGILFIHLLHSPALIFLMVNQSLIRSTTTIFRASLALLAQPILCLSFTSILCQWALILRTLVLPLTCNSHVFAHLNSTPQRIRYATSASCFYQKQKKGMSLHHTSGHLALVAAFVQNPKASWKSGTMYYKDIPVKLG